MQVDGPAVAAECWSAAIPVQLRLADSEVSSVEQPPVLYFLVPRQSYLHSLVPRGLQLLQHLLPPGELTPWFEHGHLPLKWGVPAGVLYDLVAAPSGELPWKLTIHFRGFPSSMLPAYSGESALRASFFNSLKEAAFICRNSAQRVMEMAAGAQEDLWRQVLASCLQQYRQIIASLQLAPVARAGRRPAVPLRLFVRRDAGGYLSSYEDISYTSRPVDALAADGSSISLRQALLPLLEQCLGAGGVGGAAGAGGPGASASLTVAPGAQSPARTTSAPPQELGAESSAEAAVAAAATADSEVPGNSGTIGSGGSVGQGGTDGPAAGNAAAAVEGEEPAQEPWGAAAVLDQAASGGRVLVGGTMPPLEAPLAWLHAQLHSADYFLYVVVHM